MLNQSFLPGGLEARYRVEDREVGGFVVLFDNSEEARRGFEKLRSFYQESGGNFVPGDRLGEKTFGVKTSYHGYVLISLAGRFLAGAQDFPSPEKGEGLVVQIKEHLPME